VRFVC